MISAASGLSVSLALLCTGGALWAWFAVARIERELGELSGFEGIHFEI